MYMSDLWQRGEEKGTFTFAKQPASLLTNEPAINQPTYQRNISLPTTESRGHVPLCT